MKVRRPNPGVVLLVLLVGQLVGARSNRIRADDGSASSNQVQALVARAVANQHRNDQALTLYERFEHRQLRRRDNTAAVTEDKSFRVVPTGTGILRVQTEENGRPVDAEFYRMQMRSLEGTLSAELNPEVAKHNQHVEKAVRRTRERAELVDAIPKAFRLAWIGREKRNGRTLVKLVLTADTSYRPVSRTTSLLPYLGGTVWVDEEAGQLARAEVEIIRDIPVGGGIAGKAYRGGRVVMEQSEISPGIWLPTRYEYDVEGRKFLFGFNLHETIELSRYRVIGPPQEALATVQREIHGRAAATTAPSNSPL